MKVDSVFLVIVIGTVMPILRGILTKVKTSQKLKTSVGIGLSVIGGLLAQVQQGDGLLTKQMVVVSVLSFVVAQASFYGIWQPIGVSDAIDESTGSFGI